MNLTVHISIYLYLYIYTYTYIYISFVYFSFFSTAKMWLQAELKLNWKRDGFAVEVTNQPASTYSIDIGISSNAGYGRVRIVHMWHSEHEKWCAAFSLVSAHSFLFFFCFLSSYFQSSNKLSPQLELNF